jgi:hypothetical protein
MCWACEEQDLMYRYELEMAVARGVMPEGFTAADFEAAGLPVPGTVAGPVAGTVPGKSQASSGPTKGAKAANPFVCDTPDNE